VLVDQAQQFGAAVVFDPCLERMAPYEREL
jgi:hypothetical protein